MEPDATQSLLACLYLFVCSDGVHEVRISDRRSCPQHVRVFLEGVPTFGVVDSGADSTIMSKDLLKRVAAAAKLGKSRLKKVDKLPRSCDGRPSLCMGGWT